MLTLRVIETTGHESIIQTTRVTKHPGNQVNGGENIVFWDRPDGSVGTIESGTVYVMNDAGKTVSVYTPFATATPVAA
jgi:hypothetical protein